MKYIMGMSIYHYLNVPDRSVVSVIYFHWKKERKKKKVFPPFTLFFFFHYVNGYRVECVKSVS